MPVSEKRVAVPSADVELPCDIFALVSTKFPDREFDEAVDPDAPVLPEPEVPAAPLVPDVPDVPVAPEPPLPLPLPERPIADDESCWMQPVTVTVCSEPPRCAAPLRWPPEVCGELV
jgi:hypothetical protein